MKSAADAELLAVYAELEAMHGRHRWHWEAGADPFEVIVGAILVQSTAWANVEHALSALRSAGVLAPAALAALPDERIADLVRPSGQYRQKTRKLRAVLDLIADTGGLESLLALPAEALRARLLATWGIGEETADCILLYAARRPAFVIDAYTRRLFVRLGIGPATDRYADWQRFFAGGLAVGDADARCALWARYHALVVLHGKHLCRKRAPACGACSLAPCCPSAGAGR